MKRLSADDSADSRVKVGHRQATYDETGFLLTQETGFFRFDFCFSGCAGSEREFVVMLIL